MRREVTRRKMLPAFAIDIGELEALAGRLLELFDDTEKVLTSLSIKLISEELDFDSVTELRDYSSKLKGSFLEFSFWFSQGSKKVYIRTNRSPMSPPAAEVIACGETESWCAGAVETVYTFLQAHKLWYSWFSTGPMGWIFAIALYSSTTLLLFLPKEQKIGIPIIVGWLLIILTLGVLYIFRSKLFPGAKLYLSLEEKFFRRHLSEISLILAIISTAVAVINLIRGH